VTDTLQSLQRELIRLRKLIDELRSLGHIGFATALEESVEKLVSDISNLTGAPVAQATQQQQSQPEDKEDSD
jgi:hypothetical protein